jgi:hypothetical protein
VSSACSSKPASGDVARAAPARHCPAPPCRCPGLPACARGPDKHVGRHRVEFDTAMTEETDFRHACAVSGQRGSTRGPVSRSLDGLRIQPRCPAFRRIRRSMVGRSLARLRRTAVDHSSLGTQDRSPGGREASGDRQPASRRRKPADRVAPVPASVRLEGAHRLSRQVSSGELSIDPEAD